MIRRYSCSGNRDENVKWLFINEAGYFPFASFLSLSCRDSNWMKELFSPSRRLFCFCALEWNPNRLLSLHPRPSVELLSGLNESTEGPIISKRVRFGGQSGNRYRDRWLLIGRCLILHPYWLKRTKWNIKSDWRHKRQTGFSFFSFFAFLTSKSFSRPSEVYVVTLCFQFEGFCLFLGRSVGRSVGPPSWYLER